MIYNNLGHTDLFLVIVILKSPAQVATAIKELDGAPLFNKRIQVGLSKGPLKTLPSFRWGWYATESSSLHGLALRYPQVSPPKDIFSSYKTGRMVTFHEFPNDNELYLECMKWLYARLHHYNVRGLSRMIAYTPRGCPDIKRSFVTVQFETKEAAEEVQSLYNNQHFHGFPIAVGITKPPMKYLGASWDTGHNQAHNQPRDHGTAEGTNFESVWVPLAFLFGRLSCTTTFTCSSLLTCIRCRMKCIGNGFLGVRTGASGCQDISIESSNCYFGNVRD
jgi:hypothetical protein